MADDVIILSDAEHTITTKVLPQGWYRVKEDCRTYTYQAGQITVSGVLLFEREYKHDKIIDTLFLADGTYITIPSGWRGVLQEADEWMPSQTLVREPGAVDVAQLLSEVEKAPTVA